MPTRVIRIFVVHAEGDDSFREKVASQARTAKMAVEFLDMPTKMPWVPHWKATCRTRVFQCDGAILLITSRTQQNTNLATELDFVNEFQIPVLAVYMDQTRGSIPEQAKTWPLIEWNWEEVARFIRSLGSTVGAASGTAPR